MSLQGKRVAIVATDGFEQSELFVPLQRLKDEGAEVAIVSLEKKEIKAWDKTNWGKSIEVDKTVDSVSSSEFEALMLPGGVINPDILRIDDDVIDFVRAFFKEGKPVGAICHAPQILINAEVVENRTMTSYKSIKKDLMNAGANWVDEEVVCDQALVTSRNPGDLPAFCDKLIEEIREGVHQGQTVNA